MNAAKKTANGLTLALPKGRIFGVAIERLMEAELLSKSISDKSRTLIHLDKGTGVRTLILRNTDVPTYVERGAADLGVIGKDVLLEQGQDVYEPLDLHFAPCRMIVAVPEGMTWEDLTRRMELRVATKFPAIASRFFVEQGIQVQPVRLYGNVEIAPAIGVADVVVDLVETGSTLKANNLVVVKEIFSATARLIVNRASLKTKHDRVSAFISSLRKVCKPEKKKRR